MLAVLYVRSALPASIRPLLSCLDSAGTASGHCISYVDHPLTSLLALSYDHSWMDWMYVSTIAVFGGKLELE